MEPLDVVVLAGGRSRRLGRDKVVVEVGGRRQVDRVVATATELGGEVLLATPRALPPVAGARVVPDHPGLAGPLAGIVGGLAAAETSLVAVLAVDLLAPSVALLHGLAEELDCSGAPGLVPMVAGRWQHLHAVIRADLGPALAATGHRSVEAAFVQVGVEGVPEQRWRRWAPGARPDQDLDTPADLARAREGLGSDDADPE